VAAYSTAVLQSSNLVFDQCQFKNNNFGLVIDDDVHSVLINGSKWENLYKGAKLGEGTTGTGSSVEGPKALNISNCFFNSIYSTAIHVYAVNDITSSFNHFQDVGNHLAGSPFDNVLIFGDSGCASICDSFERSDAEDASVARITLGNKANFYLRPYEGFQNGRWQQRPATQITLNDNTVSATSTGITFDASTRKANRIYYTAARGSNIRHGVMTVTASSSGVTLSDDYQEDGSDIGLTFSATVSAGTTTLKYTTTNTGSNVTFTYGVDHLNYV